jgi:hypothetical protein
MGRRRTPSRRSGTSTMRSGASPRSVLVPISQVTGRSVLARSVK